MDIHVNNNFFNLFLLFLNYLSNYLGDGVNAPLLQADYENISNTPIPQASKPPNTLNTICIIK